MTGRGREVKVVGMSEVDYMIWSDFNVELGKASTVYEVLSAYLALDKEHADAKTFDKIASRLLEFSSTDYAMKFIEMAETRRSNKELASRISDGIDKVFIDSSIHEVPKNLGSIASAIANNTNKEEV